MKEMEENSAMETEVHEEVWSNCLKVIKDNIQPQSFKTWFEPIKPIKLVGKVLTIQVPSLFFFEWLEEHYVDLIRKTIKKEIGTGAKLEYNVLVDGSSNSTESSKSFSMPQKNSYSSGQLEINVPSSNHNGEIINPFIIPLLKKTGIDSQLNPKFTFDNFIEGECNRLARSAGIAIAAKPGGTSFNPLFIYGGVGLGKTHLSQAIGNQIRASHKSKNILYITSEKFTSKFVEAIRSNSTNEFLNFYNLIDVLIVEDVEFFAGKERTQDIFFHIFNHLQQNGKQIILTSDRPPKDLQGIEERLLSRFKWGLSADIKAPDYETRVAILEQKMYNDGIELPKDVIEHMALQITGSVRELEGVIVSLSAQSTFNKAEINLSLAKEVLKSFIKHIPKELTIDQIQKIVCETLEVQPEQLKQKTRKREVVQARQISMYFARKLNNDSLTNIGKHFGGRDHSTVIHACKTVNDLMDTDIKFREKVNEIEKLISINFG